jgi:hypothetical protein
MVRKLCNLSGWNDAVGLRELGTGQDADVSEEKMKTKNKRQTNVFPNNRNGKLDLVTGRFFVLIETLCLELLL